MIFLPFLLLICSTLAINPFTLINDGEKQFQVFKELISGMSRSERLFNSFEQEKRRDVFNRTSFANGYLVITSYSGKDCIEPSLLTQYIAINQCGRSWDFAEYTEHWYSFLFTSVHLSLLQPLEDTTFHLSLFPIKAKPKRFLRFRMLNKATFNDKYVLVETIRYVNDNRCGESSNRTLKAAVAPLDQCYERTIISYAPSIDTAHIRNVLSMRLYNSFEACNEGLKYHEEGIIQVVHIPVETCIRTGKNDIMISNCNPYEDKSFSLAIYQSNDQTCQGLSLKEVQIDKASCSNPGEMLHSFGFSGYFDFVCL